MKPTLLILAAGMGTRFGGLKQIDPIGPNGEIIIDYSIYDAIKAGFGKVVFVIRHCFEDAFKQKIGEKFNSLVKTAYAYQEVGTCADGFELPKDRDKPWGTGHAILVAGDLIDEPFVVVNADDYYGPDSFRKIARFLTIKDLSENNYVMIGYSLRDTLSEYGYVSRGICRCDEQMFLKGIIERKKIEYTSAGICYIDGDGKEHVLTGDEIVSRNMWGFQPSIFRHLKLSFRRFLEERSDEKDSELFIPTVVDELIKKENITVKVLNTDDKCFGVTYRRDTTIAAECIRQLIKQGLYPENLWDQS
jgi:UTP-glucose-1-phosphate uridylyltransferase